jgi:hypothetical protein
MAQPFLTSALLEVNCQFHVPVALPPGKRRWYPPDKKLGGLQIRSGPSGEERISCLCRESNPGRPALARRYTD